MILTNDEIRHYWKTIPIGKHNAYEYADLCYLWDVTERRAREILHELSGYDSGDDYILIRSSASKGFYRTDCRTEIEAYKRECLAKGRSIFAPIRKINRVLNAETQQMNFINNLRVAREAAGLTQGEVCAELHIKGFDKSLLSKMENGVCAPTNQQIYALAQIYGCETHLLFTRVSC